MGLDAVILFQKEGDEDVEWGYPLDFIVRELEPNSHRKDDYPDATHEVCCCGERYYEKGYERGSWPRICAALMSVHATAGVKQVWYGSDCGSPFECPPGRILEISKHYMEHGRRPWFNPTPQPEID